MPARNSRTNQKQTARRLFFLLVGLVVAGTGVAAWAVVSGNWVLVALWCIAAIDMMSMARQNYSIGWPGSRISSYGGLLRIRLSKVQQIVVGIAFIALAITALALFSEGNKRALLAFAALVLTLWIVRLLWTLFKEGYGGGKERTP
jgi:hypothetical protein